MHIVALNHVYWPNSAATAQLLTELLEAIAARGHRVTVVCRQEAGHEGGREEVREGVRILRVRDAGLGKRTLLHRAADYASFYLGATAALAGIRESIDALLPLTTPPLLSLAAQAVGRLRGVPVVSVVQDLYPDVAVALGAIPQGSLVHRGFLAASRLSLCRSEAVVVLSEAMRRRVLAYGVDDARIRTIGNWALGAIDPADARGEAGREARLRYGLGDRFVVMYSGNMGAGHQFDTLLGAARALREDDGVVFAFVGDGVRRPEIEAAVARDGLTNVRLLPLAPLDFLGESLAAADVHVVTMRDDMVGLIVPSKLYGIYAAERPCLFIGPAEADVAESIAEAGAGASFPNGDVAGVVAWLEALRASPETAEAMGRAGRAHLSAAHGRAQAVDAYLEVLSRAAGAVGTPPPDAARPERVQRRAP
jgi:colanic acid biosynthesis glycosyl transferase WcaI